MELVQAYLKNQIPRTVREIYLQVKDESLDENMGSREALQYLLYWNTIPDDLFEETDLLLENKSTNMEIHKIYKRFLEIINFRTHGNENNN